MNMRVFPTAMILLAAVLTVSCGKPQVRNDFQDYKLTEFKERISFDDAVRRAADTRMVVFEWPKPQRMPPLEGRNWTPVSDSIVARSGGAEAIWNMASNEDTMTLGIYISSYGAQTAMERFLELTTENTMPLVPYERVEPTLGTITVQHIGSEDTVRILWFQNLTAKIIGPHKSVVDFSEWIQQVAEKHLIGDIEQHFPGIQSVSLSPEKVSVGESGQMEIRLSPEHALDRYKIEAFAANDLIVIDWHDGAELEFRGVEPGIGKVSVQVIDRHTMLTSSQVIEVTVTGH